MIPFAIETRNNRDIIFICHGPNQPTPKLQEYNFQEKYIILSIQLPSDFIAIVSLKSSYPFLVLCQSPILHCFQSMYFHYCFLTNSFLDHNIHFKSLSGKFNWLFSAVKYFSFFDILAYNKKQLVPKLLCKYWLT